MLKLASLLWIFRRIALLVSSWSRVFVQMNLACTYHACCGLVVILTVSSGIDNALGYLWKNFLCYYTRAPEAALDARLDVESWIKLSDLVIEHGTSPEDCQNFNGKLGNLLFYPVTFDQHCMPSRTLEKLFRYLIGIGSDIEARNNMGDTPLLYATQSLSKTSVRWIRVLIASGADLTANDNKGLGVFHRLFGGTVRAENQADGKSILYKFPNMYKDFKAKAYILLNAGCDPFQPDLEGHMPACYARDISMLALWQSILELWMAREGSEEQHTCECGGLFPLVDLLGSFRDELYEGGSMGHLSQSEEGWDLEMGEEEGVEEECEGRVEGESEEGQREQREGYGGTGEEQKQDQDPNRFRFARVEDLEDNQMMETDEELEQMEEEWETDEELEQVS